MKTIIEIDERAIAGLIRSLGRPVEIENLILASLDLLIEAITTIADGKTFGSIRVEDDKLIIKPLELGLDIPRKSPCQIILLPKR